jgi:hypothetical protein
MPWLNTRYFEGINDSWKALIKNTNVPYVQKIDGITSTGFAYNHIFIPALGEITFGGSTQDNYGTFDIFIDNTARQCTT